MSPLPHRRPVIEALEPRILYSADLALGLATPADLASPTDQQMLTDEVTTTAPLRAVAFIDASLADLAARLEFFEKQQSSGRQIDVVVLDQDSSGIDRITAMLANSSGIDTVHLVGDAGGGALRLGSDQLDAAALLTHAAKIASWGNALDAGGAIVVGADRETDATLPASLLNGLASLTGAEVEPAGSETSSAADVNAATVMQHVARTNLRFESNVGQAPAGVDFLARGGGYVVQLESSGATLQLRAGESYDSVRLSLVGAAAGAGVSAEGPVVSRTNYLVGQPEDWLQEVPSYAAVRYSGVYDGIDLRYYGNEQRLEYDFIVAPGADWRQIGMRFDGALGVSVSEDGALLLSLAGTGGRTIRFEAPVSYQEGPDGREAVESRYVLAEDGSVRFEVGAYDQSRALVVDPVLSYGTYFGTASAESGQAVAIGNDGSVYLAGTSGTDAVVVKLSADLSTVLYTTYIGGLGNDQANGIAVDAAGNAYIVGTTDSASFYGTPVSGTDLFLVKVSANGSSLLYTHSYGTGANDEGNGVAIDGTGQAYVTGATGDAGAHDAAILRFNATGTPTSFFSFGGSGDDRGLGIAIDASGQVAVAGETTSADVGAQLVNAYDQTLGNTRDGFVVQLNTGAASIRYATLLGGDRQDAAYALAYGPGGLIYVTGDTDSLTFPTTAGALQGAHGNNRDAFLSIIDPALSGGASLIYSSYLGGDLDDIGRGIAVDASGMAHIVGSTESTYWAITGDAAQASNAGSADGFYVVWDPAGNGAGDLRYGTYLGGTGRDDASAIALSASAAAVVGTTGSPDGLSRPGGADTSYAAGNDAFAVAFSYLSNQAPQITSNGGGLSATVSVAENSTAVTTVTASDADGDPITFSISGDDAACFVIDPTSGALAFATAPNFEAPIDADADNVYDVTVQVSDGSLTDMQAIAVSVTDGLGSPGAATGMLWFTTASTQAGPAGGATWSAGQLLQYGNLGDRFDIDGGTTTGTVDVLAGFTAPVPLRGMHYVQTAITIGSGAGSFALQPGDLLLVLDPGSAPATVTLNAGDADPGNNIVADRKDIVVYRPSAAGNYASGEYFMLLDDGVKNGATSYNVHALALIEADTTVGGVLLPAGTFVVAHSTPAIHNNVYTFTVTGAGVGAATVTSNTSLLLDGDPLGLPANGDQIQGLHVLTGPTAFNDSVLPAGTMLVAIKGSHTFAGVTQDAYDIVALNVAQTERNGGTSATGQRLFDGSDLGITATNINGLTVVTGAAANSVAYFTSAPTAVVPENSTAVTTVTASDADGDPITFSISGDDAARFVIDPTSGALAFATAPNFEAPADADADNEFEITVSASDGAGGIATQDIRISVSNVNEAPVNAIALADQTAAANAAFTYTIASGAFTDPDAADTLSYAASLAGGAPLPDWLSFDATTRTFSGTPANVNAGTLTLRVSVTDAAGLSAFDDFMLNVATTNSAPLITSNGGGFNATVSVAENSTAVTTVTASDADGDPITFSISGDDAARFVINPTTGALTFVAAPDFEAPADADANNVYQLTVSASDGAGGIATQDINLRVGDVNDLPTASPTDDDLPTPEDTGGPKPRDTGNDAPAIDTLSLEAPRVATIPASSPSQGTTMPASGPAPAASSDTGEYDDRADAVAQFTSDPALFGDAGSDRGENTAAVGASNYRLEGSNDARTRLGMRGEVATAKLLQGFMVPQMFGTTLLGAEQLSEGLQRVDYLRQLDLARQSLEGQVSFERQLVGASAAFSMSLSAGYVLWLLRGGALLSSLVSSLPAWHLLDPLPVLRNAGDDEDDEAEPGDRVERVFDRGRSPPSRDEKAPPAPPAAAQPGNLP